MAMPGQTSGRQTPMVGAVRSGDPFEELVGRIFTILATDESASVELDVQLEGHDGPRQIDVLVRSSVGPVDLLTIVECKDFDRRIDVTKVDALQSVLQDVNASKGVLVSRKGFSRTAIRKAKRIGMALLRADDLSNLPGIVLDVPVAVRELGQVQLGVDLEVFLEGGTSIEKMAFVRLNDEDLPTLLREELLDDPQVFGKVGGRHEWDASALAPPYFIRDAAGNKWELAAAPAISYSLRERHYFGYLSDLETIMFLHDEVKDESQVLMPAEALTFGYDKWFSQFDGPEQFPVKPELTVAVLVLPDAHQIPTVEVRMGLRRS